MEHSIKYEQVAVMDIMYANAKAVLVLVEPEDAMLMNIESSGDM